MSKVLNCVLCKQNTNIVVDCNKVNTPWLQTEADYLETRWKQDRRHHLQKSWTAVYNLFIYFLSWDKATSIKLYYSTPQQDDDYVIVHTSRWLSPAWKVQTKHREPPRFWLPLIIQFLIASREHELPSQILEVSDKGFPFNHPLWISFPNHSMEDHCTAKSKEECELLIRWKHEIPSEKIPNPI